MADEKMDKMKDLEIGELSDDELGVVTGGDGEFPNFKILGPAYIGGCPGCSWGSHDSAPIIPIDYKTEAVKGYPARHFKAKCTRCGYLFEG